MIMNNVLYKCINHNCVFIWSDRILDIELMFIQSACQSEPKFFDLIKKIRNIL